MPKQNPIYEAGAASPTRGSHELTAEHMARTNGVIPRGSVPPPDAERKLPRKAKRKAKKEDKA